ncbi:MAG: hypothetical protein VX112_04205 [Pseudomonadota bacterium]|nr:hypothetical protein [Pseudomonadota bacterium]
MSSFDNSCHTYDLSKQLKLLTSFLRRLTNSYEVDSTSNSQALNTLKKLVDVSVIRDIVRRLEINHDHIIRYRGNVKIYRQKINDTILNGEKRYGLDRSIEVFMDSQLGLMLLLSTKEVARAGIFKKNKPKILFYFDNGEVVAKRIIETQIHKKMIIEKPEKAEIEKIGLSRIEAGFFTKKNARNRHIEQNNIGKDSERYLIEYAGEDLVDSLLDKKLLENDHLEYLEQVGKQLTDKHARNISHGDLKLDNILRDVRGDKVVFTIIDDWPYYYFKPTTTNKGEIIAPSRPTFKNNKVTVSPGIGMPPLKIETNGMTQMQGWGFFSQHSELCIPHKLWDKITRASFLTMAFYDSYAFLLNCIIICEKENYDGFVSNQYQKDNIQKEAKLLLYQLLCDIAELVDRPLDYNKKVENWYENSSWNLVNICVDGGPYAIKSIVGMLGFRIYSRELIGFPWVQKQIDSIEKNFKEYLVYRAICQNQLFESRILTRRDILHILSMSTSITSMPLEYKYDLLMDFIRRGEIEQVENIISGSSEHKDDIAYIKSFLKSYNSNRGVKDTTKSRVESLFLDEINIFRSGDESFYTPLAIDKQYYLSEEEKKRPNSPDFEYIMSR